MPATWFTNAVVYCLDVETYYDSNGDGIGDFRGLTDKLSYLSDLGIECLWLMPFYSTPNRDDGYDVLDHCAVDPRLGTLKDFQKFIDAAERYGIRVVIDLIVNHTSIDHPWFQAARRDPRSHYREYYIWSAQQPQDITDRLVFPGSQQRSWNWDAEAHAWYLHRFYEHEPDLNLDNPEVREEIRRIIVFWLDRGVSGYRIDGVPFIIERVGGDGRMSHEVFRDLSDLRRMSEAARKDAVLIGEANMPPDAVLPYFGAGDRLHVVLDFLMAQHVFLAMAAEDARPIAEMLTRRPDIPTGCSWGVFLRNHDELDLGRLSPGDRDRTIAAFGRREEMQIYGRGLRRRLATMLEGNQDRLALAFSLLFSLPGTPMMFYGDEIGMAEDLLLPERLPVRTPMQWTNEPAAGFSTAELDRLVRPVPVSGRFAPESVNVTDQLRRPDSLLRSVAALVRARRTCPEIGVGRCTLMRSADPVLLFHRMTFESVQTVFAHNLSHSARSVAAAGELRGLKAVLVRAGSAFTESSGVLHLGPYGYAWLRSS